MSDLGVPTFFDNLDSFAEAPEGVAKLRELILDLAVRGKLVEQDENDEPASELLEEIGVERERLIKAKKIKRTKLLPPVENGEQPFDLPSGWQWARLDRVFLVVTDGDHRAPPRADDGIPFLVIGNVRKGDLDFTSTRFVRRDYFDELDPLRKPTRGDLLYTVTGSYGIPVAVKSDQPFCVQRHIGILKPPRAVNVEYLHRVLSSAFVFDQATACATGIAQKTVPLAGLRKMMVPLPPLSEQRRIVSKVDGLMSLCDELESRGSERVRLRDRASRSCLDRLVVSSSANDLASAWQRLSDHFEVLYDTPETLAHLRQSILQLAVQGKLVPQDPNDEPASELFGKIQDKRTSLIKQKKMPKPREQPPIKGDEVAFDLPSGWELVRLDHLTRGISDGVHKKPNYVDAGIPFVTVRNLTVGPGISFDSLNYVTREDHEEFLKRTHPEKGDILITKDGTIGVVRIIETDVEFSIFVSVALVKPVVLATNRYLALALSSPIVQDQIVPKGAALEHLHLIDLRKLAIPLPPLAEQKRIVAKVDQLLSQCDELSARLRERQSTTQQLLTATIHRLLNEV